MKEFADSVKDVKTNSIKNKSFNKAKNLCKEGDLTFINKTEAYYVEKPNFPYPDESKPFLAFSGAFTVFPFVGAFIELARFRTLAHRKNLKDRNTTQVRACQHLRGQFQKGYSAKSGQGGQPWATEIQNGGDRAVKKAVSVVIDNTTEETVEVKAEETTTALAEALSKLTPGVKTVVEGEC